MIGDTTGIPPLDLNPNDPQAVLPAPTPSPNFQIGPLIPPRGYDPWYDDEL